MFNILIDLFLRDLNQLVDKIENENLTEKIIQEEKIISENLDKSILSFL